MKLLSCPRAAPGADPKLLNNNLFWLGSMKSRLTPKNRPRGPNEGSRGPKRARRALQGTPRGQKRQQNIEPQERPGPRTARRPKIAQERSKRGPGEPQNSPRRGPGAPRGPGQRGKDKRRQEQTRPAAGRAKKLRKGLPEPLSPEPLGPYPTYSSRFACTGPLSLSLIHI